MRQAKTDYYAIVMEKITELNFNDFYTESKGVYGTVYAWKEF